MTGGHLILISGARGVGKSSLCHALVDAARQRFWQVSGIFCPGEWENGERITILAEDIQKQETRRLASVTSQSSTDLHLGMWYFDRSVLAWGNKVLENSIPTGLLVVDELGPLELVRQEGWQHGIKALQSKKYGAALVVIRPELVEKAKTLLPIRETIWIDNPGQITASTAAILAKFEPFIETQTN